MERINKRAFWEGFFSGMTGEPLNIWWHKWQERRENLKPVKHDAKILNQCLRELHGDFHPFLNEFRSDSAVHQEHRDFAEEILAENPSWNIKLRAELAAKLAQHKLKFRGWDNFGKGPRNADIF